jgi:hypothetical protein
MNLLKLILKSAVVLFAAVGLALSGAYIAVKLHWTDTKGIVDEQGDSFWENGEASIANAMEPVIPSFGDKFFNKRDYCLMKAVKNEYRGEFTRILNLALAGEKDLARKNLDNLAIVLTGANDNDFDGTYRLCSDDPESEGVREIDFKILADMIDDKSPYAWANSEEWTFFKTGVLKDTEILDRVEKETGVSKRILVAELMAEQMRLFYSDRPWFKKAIEPLKVLGSMTQFSWGIFGVKPETAMKIEDNLKNEASPFYPGSDYAGLLDFKTGNIQQERFNRLTDSDNHYYAYLYAALYNKEIISQWKRAGIPISDRPEILATLYNIGFAHSSPNYNAKVGGAELIIGDSVYSFGGLAKEFYYSKELLDQFPQ